MRGERPQTTDKKTSIFPLTPHPSPICLPLSSILCLLLFFSSVSSARYITFDTTVRTTTKTEQGKDILAVSVELTNNGDEPAYSVRIRVKSGGRSQAGLVRQILGVKEILREEFEFDISFGKLGKYPILVRTDFADANQHPFSALSLSLINYRGAASPKIFFDKPEPLEIAKKGELCLKIKSLDEKERDINVRLILPRELDAAGASVRKIRISPREEKDMCFTVSNFSALVGSAQAVFGLLEYDDEENHFSVSVMTAVKIIEREKLALKSKFIILGIPAGLLVLFLVILAIRRRRKRRRGGRNIRQNNKIP